jgi:predicted transcriptional regulator
MFRRVIPKQYRDLLGGKHEIRRSLQCHHRPTAIVHARRYTVSTDELFQKLKKITQALEEKHTRADEILLHGDSSKN